MKVRRQVCSSAELGQIDQGGPIPEGASHYFIHVLRLEVGDPVEMGDGKGRVLSGRLASSAQGWFLEERSIRQADQGGYPPITLLAGLTKTKTWRFTVEKSVELGVAALVPVITDRAVVRLHGRDRERFVEHWQRIVLEAGKQCRRPMLTQLEPPSLLTQALAGVRTPNRLVGSIRGDHSGWKERIDPSGAATILIGPEGGLTDEEIQEAHEAGFIEVSLGPYPMRAETALIALVALVRDRLEIPVLESGYGPCP